MSQNVSHLKVQQACARQVIAVLAHFKAGIREDLVVVGPGWGWQVDDLVGIMRSQELASHLSMTRALSELRVLCPQCIMLGS